MSFPSGPYIESVGLAVMRGVRLSFLPGTVRQQLQESSKFHNKAMISAPSLAGLGHRPS